MAIEVKSHLFRSRRSACASCDCNRGLSLESVRCRLMTSSPINFESGTCPIDRWPGLDEANPSAVAAKEAVDALSDAVQPPVDPARFLSAEQRSRVETRRQTCIPCDSNRGLTALTVNCRSCGCAGVSLVHGRCYLNKWPNGAGAIIPPESAERNPPAPPPRKVGQRPIVLRNHQSPGDIVVLTAAVRDLAKAHGDRFHIQVDTSCKAIWENNPYVTVVDSAADYLPGSDVIQCEYPGIHQSNHRPHHFIQAFVENLEKKLGVSIPITAFKGDIHLSDDEKNWVCQVHEEEIGHKGPFWIMIAGGKYDFTAKWWNPEYAQEVVDHFKGKITFVQCGEAGHWHPPLKGAINLIGKTDLRQFIRLMYHAEGAVCPVTFAMHAAAAVPTKDGGLRPCVVIAGGREPAHWEQYPGHQFLHTIGQLPCCKTGGCWKSRCQKVGDGDEKDRSGLCEMPVEVREGLHIAKCMHSIVATDLIHAINRSHVSSLKAKHCWSTSRNDIACPAQKLSEGFCSARLVARADVATLLERIPSAWRGLEDFVQGLIVARQPKNIVDLGVYHGYSSIAMAAATAGNVFGIDSFRGDPYAGFEDNEDACRKNVADSNLANLHIIKGDFQEVSRRWSSPIDMLHIDGSHDYESVQRDFFSWRHHLADEAIVLLHDTQSYPQGPGQLFRDLPYRKFEISEHHGLGVLFISKEASSPSTGTDQPAERQQPKVVASEKPHCVYPSQPLRIGMVIGTFAAVPYIHLQMEARKRFYPDIPVLVHDDCSERSGELANLCKAYGVAYESNAARQPHHLGDLTAFLGGLNWAEGQQLDLLVKVSRRWLFRVNWVPDLERLAIESQYSTFSNWTSSYAFGFRTECMAMSVSHWSLPHIRRDISDAVIRRKPVFVENFMHQFAIVQESANCKMADEWRRSHPTPPERAGYAAWELMGTDRCRKEPSRLWHDSDAAADYMLLAKSWGLNYSAVDFADPNQREGTGTSA